MPRCSGMGSAPMLLRKECRRDHVTHTGTSRRFGSGGTANFYHIALAEYERVLTCLAQYSGPETLVIPSVGPNFGTMMDQAKIVRKFKFPTVMVLPMQGMTTSRGVEA